jgi:CO/xanthine dehydrogenase Mo-binding subunit
MNQIPSIGRSFPRQDALDKVTGREKYAVDYYGRDLVWAGIKRAGIPHARLKGIEIDSAKNLPGVLAVLTHKDVSGSNRQGIIRKDQPVLVDDKARHCGDAVALVLTEDKAVLKNALDLISIDWEALPGVFEIDQALGEGAPLIHEDHPEGNILLKGEISKGQVEAGFKDCECLVEAAFQFSYQEHAYLETEAGLAFLKDDGCLEMVISTQTPFRDRIEVAEAVGFDQEKIRIIVPYCGGAFGGKDGITVQSLLALAARYCPGRAIKMWWDREESFLAGSKRHPVRLQYRLGAKADGTFQALDVLLYYDTGPYDHLGGAIMALGLEHAGGPYRIPHVHLKSWAVYTNNPLSGAFRGFGVPQVAGAMEQMVDLAAEKLGISPLDIRLRNAVKPGDTNPIGVTLGSSTGVTECLQTIKEHPLWKEGKLWKSRAPRFKRRGIGLAAAMHGMGYGPIIPDWGRAKIELTREGKFRLYCGVVDMGQGNASTYLQMAGALLNQEAPCIELVLPDTGRTLPSGSASASRTTYTFGNALIGAAKALKEQLRQQAALRLKIEKPDELHLVPGEVRHDPSGKRLSLSDLARGLDDSQRAGVCEFQAPTCGEEPTKDPNLRLHGIPHLIFSYGAHLTYVEVDELTGRVEVKKYLSVTDCGRVINPQSYEQQMQGGIAQGLGYALFEDFKVEQGRVRTPDLATYIIPTAVDLPDMETLAVEIPEPSGPFGLKGAGEIAIDAPLPAVANALAQAIGKRIFRSPLTAERILQALNQPLVNPRS